MLPDPGDLLASTVKGHLLIAGQCPIGGYLAPFYHVRDLVLRSFYVALPPLDTSNINPTFIMSLG